MSAITNAKYEYKEKHKKYLTVRLIPKSNRKIIETEANSIPLIYILHDNSVKKLAS